MRSTGTHVNNLGKKFAFATKMQSCKIPSCLYQRNLLPLEESKLLQEVPKCGSTFWMQVFLTLEKIKSVENVFGSGRNKYHTIAMNKTSTWDHVSSNDVIFHVTRNPYSRLYSVYIDKIYLPGFWKFTKKINERKGRECSTSVRFGEFLDNIMKEEVYDPHWQPVSEL